MDIEIDSPDRRDDELVGCAALKELDPNHGELTSMRTTVAARGTGVGKALLFHLVAEGRSRGYSRLSLETGKQEYFAPARSLYASQGFTACGPFADYSEDPHSAYFTLVL